MTVTAQGLTQNMVDAAFEWLSKSSEDLGLAKGQLNRTKFKASKVHARLFLHAAGSVESRKAQATIADEYEQAMEAYFEAEEVWTRMEDQKSRAETILDVFRTLQANERAIGRAVR
jgi:hypothetical protein